YAERGQLGMGDEIQIVTLIIKRSWVRSVFGDIAKNLIAWQMNSDNLFPTINRNDLLLIDTRVDKINGSGVYAFIQDEKIMIRRILERLDGQIDIINENPSYKDFNKTIKNMNIAPEMKILGRIVFVGKTL
ncbi:MAG: S24 family peptidase, partial [Deltaproteobacteria bacterium]|nr:S24 family peptidase [Deltaproteobacteria bacterium]